MGVAVAASAVYADGAGGFSAWGAALAVVVAVAGKEYEVMGGWKLDRMDRMDRMDGEQGRMTKSPENFRKIFEFGSRCASRRRSCDAPPELVCSIDHWL